jgi:hypothetical protein
MSEVFTQSDTRLATRLVLLALADAANDSHRMCWESVDTIATKARVSRRQVFTALATLEERRVVEHVPDAEKPVEAERYKSVVRRVLPVSEWLPEPSKGAESAPPSKGAESARVSKFSPNPNNQLVVREIEKTTSSPPRQSARSDPDEAEETPRPGAKGWAAVAAPKRGGRKKSRKQEALERAQAEQELDPAYVVSQALGDDGPGESLAARLPASDDDLAPPVRRTPKKRSKRPSEELAEFFDNRAKEVGHPVPGSTNLGALTGTFGRWMAQGIGREEVRQMIITYWSTSWQRSDNVVAWKDFLAARGLLTQRLGKADKVDEVENNRFNEDYWS